MSFRKQFFYTSLDEESARISGIHTNSINILLVILTAVTVSLAMRVVGILLIGALMVIPAVTAMQVAKSFKQSLLFSVGFALFSVIAGLFIAYYLNLPAGGAIVLLSLVVFIFIAFIFKRK